MIRDEECGTFNAPGLPRMRGDDPKRPTWHIMGYLFAPHARG